MSKITAELVELGYKTAVIDQNTISEKTAGVAANATQKQMEYLLRILNITSEILRKIYSQPTKIGGDNAESILGEIKKQVDKYLASN